MQVAIHIHLMLTGFELYVLDAIILLRLRNFDPWR